MNLGLTGKNAMVCGSTQGIGKAVALELAALGANVTLIARNEEKLTAVKEELSTGKGQKGEGREKRSSLPLFLCPSSYQRTIWYL